MIDVIKGWEHFSSSFYILMTNLTKCKCWKSVTYPWHISYDQTRPAEKSLFSVFLLTTTYPQKSAYTDSLALPWYLTLGQGLPSPSKQRRCSWLKQPFWFDLNSNNLWQSPQATPLLTARSIIEAESWSIQGYYWIGWARNFFCKDISFHWS